MNKKATKKSQRAAADKLSFKRETVRSLRAAEVQRAVGGMICQGSCHGATCPGSVCTITVDATL